MKLEPKYFIQKSMCDDDCGCAKKKKKIQSCQADRTGRETIGAECLKKEKVHKIGKCLK